MFWVACCAAELYLCLTYAQMSILVMRFRYIHYTFGCQNNVKLLNERLELEDICTYAEVHDDHVIYMEVA